MGDQEMQFADPAWQPSQQRVDASAQQQEPYVPQPLNHPTYEQAAPQLDGPHADAPYSAGYRTQSRSDMTLRPRPRRRPGLLLWMIIAAFVIISLMGGGMRMRFDSPALYSFPMPHHYFGKMAPVQYPGVGIHPTIVINNPNGSIHVHSGGQADTLSVQVSNPEAGAPDIQQDSNGSFTINVANPDPSASTDIDVTVANEADLVLQTDTGSIDVQGVDGQMQLTSADGSIILTQVTLARDSVVKTDAGSITFDGSLNPQGTYQFETGTGTVDVALSRSASYHLHVISKGGTFNSDPPVSLSSSDSNDIDAKTDVGESPNATLTLTTDTGSINLHRTK